MGRPGIGVLMFVAHRAMEQRVLAAIHAGGHAEATMAQGRLFARIGDSGTRLTDLAEMAQVTKQTASFLVDQLERAGFVTREPDPRDARARLVVISAKGREVQRLAAEEERAVYEEWRAHLGDSDFRRLEDVLGRLREVTDPYRHLDPPDSQRSDAGGSEVARVGRPVGLALLEERVAALDGLVGHVRQPGRLAGEDLLADQAVVDGVEGELQHPLRRRALADDLPRPLDATASSSACGTTVDRAHPVHVVGGVVAAEEEDLPGELLADHLREVGAAVAAVEAADVGVGLLEARVLAAGERQVADDVQAVPAAGGPAGDDATTTLGIVRISRWTSRMCSRPPSAVTRRSSTVSAVVALGVLVARAAADALVAAGAERPAAVPRATGRCR